MLLHRELELLENGSGFLVGCGGNSLASFYLKRLKQPA